MTGSLPGQTMMRAISHGHLTRCMWIINQEVHVWTYRWPKPHGFSSMVPSGIITLCDKCHNLDDWTHICSFWGPQSDDTNLSFKTWVDLLDPSEGPFGWLQYLSPYTHDVTYFNVRRRLTPLDELLEAGLKYSCDQHSRKTWQRCQFCNDDYELWWFS